MRTMTRAWMSVGVAAVTATALTVVPSADEPTPPGPARVAAPPVLLTAAAEPLAATELPDLLGDWLQSVVVLPTAAAPTPPAVEPVVGSTSLGNAVINAWNWALPWIDYGVELADYVLGFIPGGYLIGDQIDIVYFSLVRPVANSFVVDLVGPVLNEPLNLASYVDGLVTLGQVTVNSLINLGINEFNYFFGWLIPPIPPLPPIGPLAVEAEEAVETLETVETVETVETADEDLTLAASVEDSADTEGDVEAAGTTPSTSRSEAAGAQDEVRDSGAVEPDEESEKESEEPEEVTEEVEDAETEAETDTETTPSSTDDDAAGADTTSDTDDADATGD